jgi:hypothetical protein
LIDINAHLTGNDSRGKRFYVQWTFQKQVMLGNGGQEQATKNLFKSSYGQIGG